MHFWINWQEDDGGQNQPCALKHNYLQEPWTHAQKVVQDLTADKEPFFSLIMNSVSGFAWKPNRFHKWKLAKLPFVLYSGAKRAREITHK